MRRQQAVGSVMLSIIVLMCIGVVSNCFGLGKREIEIVPGLRLTYYYVEKTARLTWDRFGVIADGTFDLVICDYGICVYSSSGKDKSLYLDLHKKSVVEWDNKIGTDLWDKIGVMYSIDTQSAIGLYCEDSRVEFEQMLDGLRERLRQADSTASK